MRFILEKQCYVSLIRNDACGIDDTLSPAESDDFSAVLKKSFWFFELTVLIADWYYCGQLLCSVRAAGKPLRERPWSHKCMSLAASGREQMVSVSDANLGHEVHVLKPYCPRTP